MKLGRKVKINRLQVLLEKSESIKNIFTDTISELEVVNNEIDEEVAAKTRRIEALQQERETLTATRSANEKMRTKMAVFLGLEDDSDKAVSVETETTQG